MVTGDFYKTPQNLRILSISIYRKIKRFLFFSPNTVNRSKI